MNNLSRLGIAYFLAIPLALALGFLVAIPNTATMAAVTLVVLCLALPLFIQWHHAALILTWNSAFMLGFLPGQPRLWLALAALSFGIAVINNVIGLKAFLRVPELTRPILFLLGVIVVTGYCRGGVGSKIFGSSGYGGRNYAYVFGAIMGYFALTAQRIPIAKSQRTMKMFFLSAVTNVFSNLAYILGPAFYGLYYFVSSNSAISQYQRDMGQDVVNRFADLAPAATGLLCFMMAGWGVRGIFEPNKPWRLLLLIAVMAGGLLSGFRSQVAFLAVLFAVQFVMEGLWKTALLPLFCLLAFLCLIPMLFFANKMPLAVQRSLAFLPLNIYPEVRDDANGSTQWRLDLWRAVWPDVPKYLLLGKGYYIDPLELNLTESAAQSGLSVNSYDLAIVAGDYHSGPLSVLIPFGFLGAVGFLWLLGAGTKMLYFNYRYGDARLRQINMLLFSYFLTQCLFFFFVFGAMNAELMVFLGTLGLSVSLNGGMCRKEAAKVIPAAAAGLMLERA